MTRYIQSEVERLRESPEAGAEVRLIVGVAGGAETELLTWTRNQRGTVHEPLALEYQVITIPEDRVDALCRFDWVTSVEIDGTTEVMSAGNR